MELLSEYTESVIMLGLKLLAGIKILWCLFWIAVFASCSNAQEDVIEMSSGNLYMINTPEALQDNDTLNFFYSDRSQINESAYQSLKSNMLLYINRNAIKEHEWVKTITYIPLSDQFLTKTYERRDIDFLVELYKEHQLFRDFALYLLRDFNATDLYNFSNACHAIIRHAGIDKGDYMDILFRFSIESEMEDFETSTSSKLIAEVAEVIKNAGLKEHNTGNRIKPDRLLDHLRNFYVLAGKTAPF